MKLNECDLKSHYYLFDTNQDTDPKKPVEYYQDKYYAKCQHCGHRILISDKGNGL